MWVAPIWGYPPEEVSMLMYLMVGVIGIAAVFKTCVPPNFLRMFVFFTMTAAFFVMTILFYRLLELPLLSLHLMPVFFGFTAFSILVERLCALADVYKRQEKYCSLISSMFTRSALRGIASE